MYAAIWRILPGPTWFRVLLVLLLLAAAVYALFTWVFPAVQELIDSTDVTVEE